METVGRISQAIIVAQYAATPVPVFEFTPREWSIKCKSLGIELPKEIGKMQGLYHNLDRPVGEFPNRFIIINSTNPNHRKLSALYHERGHNYCVEQRCPCMMKPGIIAKAEFHAYLHSLHHLMVDEMYIPLIHEMEHILRNSKVTNLRGLVCQAVILSEEWRNCFISVLDFIKKYLKYKEQNPGGKGALPKPSLLLDIILCRI